MARKRAVSVLKPTDDDEDTSFDSVSDEEGDEHIVSEALWSVENEKKLIADVSAQLPKFDRSSCSRRLKSIDWQKVSIEGHTAAECQEQLTKMIKKVRQVRNLSEVLEDVVLKIGKGPSIIKPQSAYTLYCKYLIQQKQDMKGKNFFQEASTNYKKLSDTDRAVFERQSAKQKELYVLEKQKLRDAKMDELTPTPFVLFCKHHMALGVNNKTVLRSQFVHLSEEERLKWILKSVQVVSESNESIEQSTFLSKTEMKLMQGVPKPPMNAYNLFVRDYCTGKDRDFKKATEQYRGLSELEKSKYVNQADELRNKYRADMKVYIETLPEEEQKLFQKTNKKHFEAVYDKAAAGSSTEPAETSSETVKSKLTPKKEAGNENAKPVAAKKSATAAKQSDNTTPLNGSPRKRKTVAESPVAKKVKMEKVEEPEKVPSSAFKYFLAFEYKGKPKKARKAYTSMDPDDKKKVKRAFKKCLKEYMSKLETYLQSLTKDEMIEYADRSRQMADESDDSCSDSSSSDSS